MDVLSFGAGTILTFSELVHLDPELDLLEDGLGVGDEAGQADPEVGRDLEDLGEVGGDGAQLDAEAGVGGEGHALLALHGDHRAAVVREDALGIEMNSYRTNEKEG